MRRCVKRLAERLRSCVKLGETLEKGLSESLCDSLGGRCGEILFKKLYEMFNADMLQVYFRQASSRIQESLNLSQLPSPDEGLVILGCQNKK